MQQYLLNTTAIWLLSLVVFDVFLSRENYHGYNRLYLLGTFLLGLVLPLLEWQTMSAAEPVIYSRPLQQVITAKETIAGVAQQTTTANSSNIQQLLVVIYGVGVAVALSILIADIIKLVAYYRQGTSSKQNKWTVIETGKAHAPFSFFNTLFVSGRQQYNKVEWDMIIAHEARHTAFLHFIDVLFIQLMRITFWFHPLVYVYQKRILLVHEYQADSPAIFQPKVYGNFLLEQALLHTAPAVAHSFNSSSVKSRLIMLTHRSSGRAKRKLLLFIPLLIVCVCFFTKNGYAHKPIKEGNKCYWRGNTIDFLPPKKPDSYMHRDEKTGKLSRRHISWPMPPIKLNGEKIYNAASEAGITKSNIISKEDGLVTYILTKLSSELSKLDDGNYAILIMDVVVDAKGAIAYYNNAGIFKTGTDTEIENRTQVNTLIDKVLEDAPVYKPATLNGVPVHTYYSSIFSATFGFQSQFDFSVKSHKISW
ncbi:MAG: hypothetical protein K9G49_05720 [Taibaiella sp.]|nr:hypothetical protein [Taibaiella sp.]